MALTFIAEVGLEFTEHELSIWEHRSHLPREKEDQYIALWKKQPIPHVPMVQKAIPLPLCPSLGASTEVHVTCRKCANLTAEVFSCSRFVKCTIENYASDTTIKACCKFCDFNPDNIARKERILKIQEDANSAKNARATDAARDLVYQKAADDFLLSLPQFPEGRYSGRGITIGTGGNYWASTYVTVRMLRHVGCVLPIQCWYLGNKGERDERYESLLKPYGVEFIDIDSHPARKDRRGVAGFQTKLFAAVNSPFEEVLSLDPDNYPCTDPTVLFEDSRYKLLGAIYWPDGPQTNTWTNWQMFGVAPRGPCGLETGQYVINKKQNWGPLLLAEWYDDRPEWTYGKPCNGSDGPANAMLYGGDYGDKGPPRVAFAKFKRDYVIYNSTVNWQQVAFIQVGPDGCSPMFIHRCRSKFMAEGELTFSTTPQTGVNAKLNLPGEEDAFRFFAELQKELKAFKSLPRPQLQGHCHELLLQSETSVP